MVTIFDKVFGYNIGGILPVWVLAIAILIIVIIFLLASRMPKKKEYKPIDLKKEIKIDLDKQYDYFFIPVGKPIYNGIEKLGIVSGYMPLIWHDRKYFKILQKKLKDGSIKDIEVQVNEKDSTKNTRAKIKVVDSPIELYALKIYHLGLINKIKIMLGYGFKYFIFDKQDINVMDDESIKINAELQRQYFFGQFIFSKAGKSIIDNTSFRIDRENQLQEIANQIPRTVFFDTKLAKRAIMAREAFALEKEKYKSQVDSMQD